MENWSINWMPILYQETNQFRGIRCEVYRIVHDYEGVNLVLVWEIISGDLAELKVQLEAIQ